MSVEGLTEFLLARIAEDEAVAHKATVPTVFEPLLRWMLLAGDDSNMPGAVLAEPSRVLAECEAKRRIVSRIATADPHPDARYMLDLVLRLLALPYADHPGYREEWRP